MKYEFRRKIAPIENGSFETRACLFLFVFSRLCTLVAPIIEGREQQHFPWIRAVSFSIRIGMFYRVRIKPSQGHAIAKQRNCRWIIYVSGVFNGFLETVVEPIPIRIPINNSNRIYIYRIFIKKRKETILSLLHLTAIFIFFLEKMILQISVVRNLINDIPENCHEWVQIFVAYHFRILRAKLGAMPIKVRWEK